MRERDLKALEFDKVIHLVMERCASDPGRAATAELRPSLDTAEVQRRLTTTAEMVDLRSHAGSIPISEFTDQRPYLLAAARAGAILGGEALVKVRDFIVGSRHVSGFLRSRVERFPHVAALVNNLLAPKELADAMLSALADDGTLLDDASPELKRLRSRLRDERADLEARLLRSLNASGMESFVSDYIVTIRNRRFVLPMKLNYSERFEGIVQDRSVSGETLFVEPMWAVESEQPPDDARARSRGGRNANPRAADRDGRRLCARVAAHLRRDGRARRPQRARAFRRALSMRRAAARR